MAILPSEGPLRGPFLLPTCCSELPKNMLWVQLARPNAVNAAAEAEAPDRYQMPAQLEFTMNGAKTAMIIACRQNGPMAGGKTANCNTHSVMAWIHVFLREYTRNFSGNDCGHRCHGDESPLCPQTVSTRILRIFACSERTVRRTALQRRHVLVNGSSGPFFHLHQSGEHEEVQVTSTLPAKSSIIDW